MTDNIVSKTVDLLSNNWLEANTGSIKPFIANITEVKRVSGDSAFVYEVSEIPQDNASGAQSKKKTKVVAVDLRTLKNFAQGILMKEEVERIFNANQIDPFSDQVYSIQDITDIQPLSDRTRGLFRYKILVKFEQFNIAV